MIPYFLARISLRPLLRLFHSCFLIRLPVLCHVCVKGIIGLGGRQQSLQRRGEVRTGEGQRRYEGYVRASKLKHRIMPNQITYCNLHLVKREGKSIKCFCHTLHVSYTLGIFHKKYHSPVCSKEQSLSEALGTTCPVQYERKKIVFVHAKNCRKSE